MSQTEEQLEWRVNTPGLLSEISLNPQCAIMRIPLRIFANLLSEVGERAAELNDPRLNALMCRLAIYSVADPNSPDYDREQTEEILKAGEVKDEPEARRKLD
jgi:hypothetical protein